MRSLSLHTAASPWLSARLALCLLCSLEPKEVIILEYSGAACAECRAVTREIGALKELLSSHLSALLFFKKFFGLA